MQTTETTYTKSGKLFFHPATAPKVKTVLNDCYDNGNVIKLYQGDVATGKAWNEEHDIIGTVGRSTGMNGINKVPLLIGAGEGGGGAILTRCIVGIKDMLTGEYLYLNPKFHTSVVTIGPSKEAGYKYSTFVDGGLYGNHKTLADALKCKDLLT